MSSPVLRHPRPHWTPAPRPATPAISARGKCPRRPQSPSCSWRHGPPASVRTSAPRSAVRCADCTEDRDKRSLSRGRPLAFPLSPQGELPRATRDSPAARTPPDRASRPEAAEQRVSAPAAGRISQGTGACTNARARQQELRVQATPSVNR